GNAIKFTHEGEVRIEIEPNRDATVPGTMRFSVTDTGIGIAPEALGSLFSAFTQADSSTTRRYGGSGLGLAIVKRLIALMDGIISVQSERGVGSTFSFTAKFDVAAPGSPGPGPPILVGSALLVVDNEHSREIMAEMLADNAETIDQAGSRTDALELIHRRHQDGSDYDVIVFDTRMSSMTESEIVTGLKEIAGGADSLLMMVNTDDLTAKASSLRALGINSYIVKPVKRAELWAAIARIAAACHAPGADASLPENKNINSAGNDISSLIINRPVKILLADDSPSNRLLVRSYLRKTSYQLEEADDGAVALEKFTSGDYDLVLMDMQMPEMDGYMAAMSIREWESHNRTHRVPIIALTASVFDDAVRKSKSAGCDAHVSKPVNKTTLLAAIRDAIQAA
ncbi:MAG TPA: response regulator, partial [Candidatus Binataceae bacterium]